MHGDVDRLLAAAPTHERSLLELRGVWSPLPEAYERVAAGLRVFVLNWDPLGWLGGPFEAGATATGDGDRFEVVLYVPLCAAESVPDLCRSVVEIGAEQEVSLAAGAYAELAHAGKVPELMSGAGQLSALELPALEPAGDWEPIGLGAIQDLVQARFGPVDLDRSSVALDADVEPVPGCPACAGQRFGFPAELADAQGEMCTPHAERAGEIAAERIRRAESSNRNGWRAIVDASSALGEPTHGLPLDLLARLPAALDRVEPSIEELRADAVVALELAERFGGRRADFAAWVEDWQAHDWLWGLPQDLARDGDVDEAVRILDAFAELDPELALYASDAAVMLADAGRFDEARARLEVNLRAFPDDVWTHVHAGDVHQAVGDLAQAESEFREAAGLARARGSPYDTTGVAERLASLLAGIPGREAEAAEAARAVEREKAAGLGQRIVTKVGRNESCPCGSGRKYKKCCGK